MRPFNKIFIVALPRCATVSLCQALGQLGIATAHLGRIYGESLQEHHHPKRLIRVYQQISQGDFQLDILQSCRGLADYPACCTPVIQQLDRHYPGSLFIDVRRERHTQAWLQSVERQFIGLQLVKQRAEATEEERQFMSAMLSLRAMTFGQSHFDPEVFLRAYQAHRQKIAELFAERPDDLLQFDEVGDLESTGFERLARFLSCPNPGLPFPNSNAHSLQPQAAFMKALAAGEIQSQTGIAVETDANGSFSPE